MAINFPNSPTLNQIAQVGNNFYIWNGNAWFGFTTSFTVNYNASSILVQDDGGVGSAATTINFADNLTLSYSSGIATISATTSGGTQTLDQTLGFGNTSSRGMSVGIITATQFIRSGGTSSQFLKADGSVDTSTYLTSYTETDTLNSVTTRGSTTSNSISVGIVTATQFVRSGGTSSQFLKADGSVDSSTYLTTTGSGINLTGIVTSITAGSGISINQSTGNVTITATGGGGGGETLDQTLALGNTSSRGMSVGVVTATQFIRSGGTSSQFLKADGSVDSSTYLTSYTETDTLNSVTTRGGTTSNGMSVGILTASIAIPTELRTRSIAERTTLVSGNTVGLSFNTGGGNVAICTSPTGDITLNVTNIPTDSSFDNHSLSFSVIVSQTGTAKTCTAVTLNGLSRTIRWSGGSLTNALSGVSTSNGYDIFTFTGINTVGSASTTANYTVLGSVNGGFN